MGMKKPKYRLIYQSSSNSSIFLSVSSQTIDFCQSSFKHGDEKAYLSTFFVSHFSKMVMKKPKYRFFSKRTSSYYHGKCSQKSLILILVLCVVPCTSQDSSLPETPICKKKKKLVFDSLSPPPSLSSFCPSFFFLASIFLTISAGNQFPSPPPPKKKLSLCLSCVYALEREGKKPPPIFRWNSDGTPFFLNPRPLGRLVRHPPHLTG